MGIDGGVQSSSIEVDTIGAGAEDPYERRFFAVRRGYREIGLAGSSQPTRHPRVEIPGQLLAIDAKGALYVSDDTFAMGHRNVFLRKLEVRAETVSVRASTALGDVTVTAMVPENDGQLVVEVMGPNWDLGIWVEDGYPFWQPGTSLLGFDANLKRQGAIEVDPYCRLRAVRDGRAILQGTIAGQGVYVIDLNDLTAPKLQAYYALDTTDEGAVLFQNGRLVIEAATGLRTVDPAASHL